MTHNNVAIECKRARKSMSLLGHLKNDYQMARCFLKGAEGSRTGRYYLEPQEVDQRASFCLRFMLRSQLSATRTLSSI